MEKNSSELTGSRSNDMKKALVAAFKEDAEIMIATEAAAEGLNLQFCSLLINYDLPWNPQRVEQRIGRVHRYGQKCDVVIINFINKKNVADVRLYDILQHKFKLFDGVFGASDEILGSLSDGIDFEKAVSSIFDLCRTTDEINRAFDELQASLGTARDEKMEATRGLQKKLALSEFFSIPSRILIGKQEAESGVFTLKTLKKQTLTSKMSEIIQQTKTLARE